jgi:hypothetical protein
MLAPYRALRHHYSFVGFRHGPPTTGPGPAPGPREQVRAPAMAKPTPCPRVGVE